MAKKEKEKKEKPRKIAARMLLSSAAGNLQLLDEFLKQTNYFGNDAANVAILMECTRKNLRDLRKKIIEYKKDEPASK